MRPKHGLSMKILRLMLGEEQLKIFVDHYMKTKQRMILNELVEKITGKEGKQFLKTEPILKIRLK
jgi:hypothetical protein